MKEHEVCELWLGPQGEQIYWIRPHDERFYWYVGGDPIAAKKIETRAYFHFGEGSLKDPMKTWLSFRDAFLSTRVKKIMCTSVDGANPADIGFSGLDELDERRIAYLAGYCTAEAASRLVSVPAKMDFDYRFSAKLALALGYSVFGNDYAKTEYAENLRRAVWFRDGNAPPPPVRGQTPLQSNTDPTFQRLTGRANIVSITITQTPAAVAAVLNIGQQHCWTLMVCPEPERLNATGMAWVGAGQVILLAPSIQAGLSMTWPQFFAHGTGIRSDQSLLALEARLTRGAPPIAT